MKPLFIVVVFLIPFVLFSENYYAPPNMVTGFVPVSYGGAFFIFPQSVFEEGIKFIFVNRYFISAFNEYGMEYSFNKNNYYYGIGMWGTGDTLYASFNPAVAIGKRYNDFDLSIVVRGGYTFVDDEIYYELSPLFMISSYGIGFIVGYYEGFVSGVSYLLRKDDFSLSFGGLYCDDFLDYGLGMKYKLSENLDLLLGIGGFPYFVSLGINISLSDYKQVMFVYKDNEHGERSVSFEYAIHGRGKNERNRTR